MLRSQIQSSLDVKRLTEAERIVSESDLTQLKACLSLPTVTPQQRAMVENLEATAVLVDPEQIPPDVVTMNTTIECTVVGSANTYHWTLVYPDKADYLMGRLSVLSPAGISLLGARCGQTVVCRPPSGAQIRYFINAILLQPESRHLAL
ncbi:GreA/GreB family elongation factor [Trinickia symbiotica]|uniref:GreA/GreB family elongation factor n=1 Tax=Trinickia symbiotica TaxID=863227 RepID=UPI0015E74377|nr:GreA/GreB family elongation factor [Trinickia symbiotica]